MDPESTDFGRIGSGASDDPKQANALWIKLYLEEGEEYVDA